MSLKAKKILLKLAYNPSSDVLKMAPDENLKKLSQKELLLRWVNFQCQKREPEIHVKNFNKDFADGHVYILLMTELAPEFYKTFKGTLENKFSKINKILADEKYDGVFLDPDQELLVSEENNIEICTSLISWRTQLITREVKDQNVDLDSLSINKETMKKGFFSKSSLFKSQFLFKKTDFEKDQFFSPKLDNNTINYLNKYKELLSNNEKKEVSLFDEEDMKNIIQDSKDAIENVLKNYGYDVNMPKMKQEIKKIDDKNLIVAKKNIELKNVFIELSNLEYKLFKKLRNNFDEYMLNYLKLVKNEFLPDDLSKKDLFDNREKTILESFSQNYFKIMENFDENFLDMKEKFDMIVPQYKINNISFIDDQNNSKKIFIISCMNLFNLSGVTKEFPKTSIKILNSFFNLNNTEPSSVFEERFTETILELRKIHTDLRLQFNYYELENGLSSFLANYSFLNYFKIKFSKKLMKTLQNELSLSKSKIDFLRVVLTTFLNFFIFESSHLEYSNTKEIIDLLLVIIKNHTSSKFSYTETLHNLIIKKLYQKQLISLTKIYTAIFSNVEQPKKNIKENVLNSEKKTLKYKCGEYFSGEKFKHLIQTYVQLFSNSILPAKNNSLVKYNKFFSLNTTVTENKKKHCCLLCENSEDPYFSVVFPILHWTFTINLHLPYVIFLMNIEIDHKHFTVSSFFTWFFFRKFAKEHLFTTILSTHQKHFSNIENVTDKWTSEQENEFIQLINKILEDLMENFREIPIELTYVLYTIVKKTSTKENVEEAFLSKFFMTTNDVVLSKLFHLVAFHSFDNLENMKNPDEQIFYSNQLLKNSSYNLFLLFISKTFLKLANHEKSDLESENMKIDDFVWNNLNFMDFVDLKKKVMTLFSNVFKENFTNNYALFKNKKKNKKMVSFSVNKFDVPFVQDFSLSILKNLSLNPGFSGLTTHLNLLETSDRSSFISKNSQILNKMTWKKDLTMFVHQFKAIPFLIKPKSNNTNLEKTSISLNKLFSFENLIAKTTNDHKTNDNTTPNKKTDKIKKAETNPDSDTYTISDPDLLFLITEYKKRNFLWDFERDYLIPDELNGFQSIKKFAINNEPKIVFYIVSYFNRGEKNFPRKRALCILNSKLYIFSISGKIVVDTKSTSKNSLVLENVKHILTLSANDKISLQNEFSDKDSLLCTAFNYTLSFSLISHAEKRTHIFCFDYLECFENFLVWLLREIHFPNIRLLI